MILDLLPPFSQQGEDWRADTARAVLEPRRAHWTLFCGESQEAFRAALAVDDATWARGRGWALSWALIFIPYYLHTDPVGVANARHTIDLVLADS